MTWFLIGTGVFVAIVYGLEEGFRAALWFVISAALLMAVGAAIWPWY